ncbi:MAG: cysteine hydrolase [Rhodospirillaceae bacterium]|nr:cysteine hydrolase [Rhodospirillaceae bacterium]
MATYVPGLYPWPFDGDLSPRNTALIAIDMQVDFCGPDGWLDQRGLDIANTRRAIAPLQRVMAAMRAAGYPVLHTREGHRPDLSDLPENKRWRSRQAGLGIGDEGRLGRVLTRGEPGWEIIPEVAPLPGETVIDKSGKGSFYATDLDQILRSKGIRNLVITGVTTDCCVQSTMRDANDRGYECLLLEDCCGAAEHANHLAQIHMLTLAGGHYGSISTADALIETLAMMEAA